MKTRTKLGLLATALLALVLAFYHSRLTRACSPQAFMPEPIFINTLHPDLPIGPYTNGNLGVIQPTYSSIYLYVAYRNLEGRPVKPEEQEALWDGNTRLLTGGAVPFGATVQYKKPSPPAEEKDWESVWFSIMGQIERGLPVPPQYLIPGSHPTLGIYRRVVSQHSGWTGYGQFLNCQQDAFREAVSTYKRLVGQFGESSSVVRNWITSQQMVFGNCLEGNNVPSPLPSSAPTIAREARAYQIAAAHFYIGDFDQAAAEFHAIGQDTSSPWSIIGPYLVARTLVRKATLGGPSGAKLSALAQAEAELDTVLSNSRYARYHHAAEQLRGLIEFRLHPQQRLVELAKTLTQFSGDPNMAQDVIDFKLLFDRAEDGQTFTTRLPPHTSLYSALAGVRTKSDLLDWLLTLKLGGPEAYIHSFEKWERTQSLAWLVAALTKASPDSPHLPEVMAAARQVPRSSPAYDSVTFQSLRLLLLQGHRNVVRERLDHLHIRHPGPVALGLPATQPSTANLFLAMGFKLARNPEELFEYAPRVPATITSGNSSQELPEPIWEPPNENDFDPSAARLDDDGIMVFNRYLPVKVLAKAVHSPKLPQNLRREVALSTWTRAALLGHSAVARSLGNVVETFVPKLTASMQSYGSSKTPAARRFAAVFAVLEFPGLRPFFTTLNRETPIAEIDDYRNNWWGTDGPVCAPPNPYNGRPGYPPLPQWPQIGRALQLIYPGGKMKPPAFLTAREDTEAASEWKRLMAMSPAPDYLSAQVLAWARTHPSDLRVPEALALAVKSTRFGCVDPKTGELSKTAFDLLHSRYPNSRWTDKTRYWFKM